MNLRRSDEQKKIYFSIFLILFAVFWSFVIRDPVWTIDNLLFLFLLGLFFLFLAKKEVIESEKELTLDIIFALSILIAVFADRTLNWYLWKIHKYTYTGLVYIFDSGIYLSLFEEKEREK